ncbi:uncharacterized protein LOC129568196 [Sitodiplosis mosellana]|uniref:uncharacterized protein LOC129568196 n=1 Tax=Sitodiplosis mosellana TaxID=263140 RepID=UPI002443C640|nr:uncharacterized protein LOC129568196 [Sitodiplosis mosellana]XP_055301816.1 uncharacterized protein LOC129568196 [Sitodiplosis mosellana]
MRHFLFELLSTAVDNGQLSSVYSLFKCDYQVRFSLSERRATSKMKLLLFVVSIFFCLKHASLQHQHQERNLEEQIHNLQDQVKIQRQFLKEMYSKFYLNSSKKSFKNEYLSERGKKPYWRYQNLDKEVNSVDEKMPKMYKTMSLHVMADFKEYIRSKPDEGIICFVRNCLRQIFEWNVSNIVANVMYVEQKQKQDAKQMGQMQYEFNREDYNECLEIFVEDLTKILAPEIAYRLISLHRIIYGNQTEIQTALTYLYGFSSATDLPTNVKGSA